MYVALPDFEPFTPRWPLRHGHLQTLVGSRGRRPRVYRRGRLIDASARNEVITAGNGIRLAATLNTLDDAPLVIIVPGFLGHARSTYVLSAASHLHAGGFSVARLHPRDHGSSLHLNEALFDAAHVDELGTAMQALVARIGPRAAGVLAFSLGANMVLRLDAVRHWPVLAVCPTLDPAATMAAVDAQAVYRHFFVRKWLRMIEAKGRGLPASAYADARACSSAADITACLARRAGFDHATDYVRAHAINPPTLRAENATVVHALDDPIVPAAGFERLRGMLPVAGQASGGHCAFVEGFRYASWLDRAAAAFFAPRLG